ncbi:MAG: site-2 protease family protein [Rhodothermaceae bacterium]
MPDIQVNERLIRFLIFLPLFFLSLAIHEFAHAWSAYKFGDNTAKNEGRLTLNPLKHIDLFGSVLMPIMAFASGFALIGWAKPVPVNPRNFRNPHRDDIVVSAAGPISNFVLSFIFFAFFILLQLLEVNNPRVFNILWMGVYFNVFLGLFNLLPIPPLDGSHIVFNLFPNRLTASFMRLGIYGTIVLMVFIYSPLWALFIKFVNYILGFFNFLEKVIVG